MNKKQKQELVEKTVELASLGITNYNAKKKTARFMGVDMAVDTAVTLSGDPDNKKKSEAQAVDADRDATDKRLLAPLSKLSTALTKLLANGSGLLPTDLSRITYEIGTDGTVDASYRHIGKPRNGEPNVKFGGFVGSTLKAHNVVKFVKLAASKSGGWNKTPLAEAADGAGICEADGLPYHAQKSADDNHKSAGCGSDCIVLARGGRHGDNANRGATYDKRSALGADGWHVELADGTRENVADLKWDTTP